MLRALGFIVLLVVALALPRSVAAEWFVDLYAGGAFTEPNDHRNRAPVFNLDVVVFDVTYDDSALLGGRAGYWFDSLSFLGLGLDASHLFGPDIDAQTSSFQACVASTCFSGPQALQRASLSVTSVGLDLLLRWPLLTSSAFPKGRLQPYVAVGPAVFVARFHDTSNFSPGGQSDTDTAVGVKAAGGLAWQLTRQVAVFGEYRFTHFKAEWDFNGGPFGPLSVHAPITTHAVLGGLSIRFP